MAALDGALLHGVQRLQAGNDLAARKDADIELAAGQGAHPVGQHVGTAEDGIQALRETRRQAPLDGGQGLGDGRCGDGGSGAGSGADGSFLQKITTLHIVSSGVIGNIGLSSASILTKATILASCGKPLVGYSPATVMRSTRIEPVCFEPRICTSLPTAAMPSNMALRLPAMVISSTG